MAEHFDDADLDGLSTKLDAEFVRLGITWDALLTELHQRATPLGGVTDQENTESLDLGLLFEYGPALVVLHKLPDGAGMMPFVAWLCSTPTWRTLWRSTATGARDDASDDTRA